MVYVLTVTISLVINHCIKIGIVSKKKPGLSCKMCYRNVYVVKSQKKPSEHSACVSGRFKGFFWSGLGEDLESKDACRVEASS